jgi:hypothetical protein
LDALVGLERLVPDVIKAHCYAGNHLWDLTMGQATGFMPVVTAKVITGVQALEILTGVTAVHIASEGVSGSEGAVVLALEGDKETVTEALELCESIKGELQIEDARPIPYVRDPQYVPVRQPLPSARSMVKKMLRVNIFAAAPRQADRLPVSANY